MSKKMRLWMAGTVGVLMAGFMSVSVYALEEKDVIGTWYVNELSMGEGASFHPGAMGMEVTVDIKEDGKMETTSSVYGEDYQWSEDRVSGADSAAESGLLSGDTGRTGSYQGDSRTVQGMDLSAL